MDEFKKPEGLDAKGEAAYEVIMRVLKEDNSKPGSGGAQVFYSPEEWRDRGEKYGTTSLLVVTHDGGDQAPYFNLDYGCINMWEHMHEELAKVGVYAEQCTSWFSAIYV